MQFADQCTCGHTHHQTETDGGYRSVYQYATAEAAVTAAFTGGGHPPNWVDVYHYLPPYGGRYTITRVTHAEWLDRMNKI